MYAADTDLIDKREYPHGLGLILQAINGQDVEQEDIHTPSIVTTPLQIERLFFSDSEDDNNEPPSPLLPRGWTSLFPDSDSERGNTPLFFPASDVESDRATPRPERPPLPLFPPDSDAKSDRGPTPTLPFPPDPELPAKRLLPLSWDTDDEAVETRKPVKKRPRRQRFSVGDFFDIEAADTDGNDSGDEADLEDGGFIDDDDEPLHEFAAPRHPRLSFALGDDGPSPEDLEALAAEYEAAARMERQQMRERQVPDKDWSDWTLDEKLKLPRPSPLAPIDSPPIFAISVAPRREFALLAFLAQESVAQDAGILSVFSWGVRSGLVCVEVRRFDANGNQILKPAACLIECLAQWPQGPGSLRQNPLQPSERKNLLQPREVGATEKFRLLSPPGDALFLDPFRIGRRWVRITGDPLYKGDLAFLEEYSPKTSLDREDYDLLHVVPRIALSRRRDANEATSATTPAAILV
ncbi:hypothetical protein C8F01DRAFT_557739 [Mycena amicta]|nr:hypothetical protein C8F01DRAFT_557739 [Mycena amicta]